MTKVQLLCVLLIFALGAGTSMAWSAAEGATALLGLVLWISFFGICNAVGWAFWWSREEWIG